MTKATFHMDTKEPKEKHVICKSPRGTSVSIFFCVDLLECMNGEHAGDVAPEVSVEMLFERYINNISNWIMNFKILIIFHRGLQNIKVNRKIHKLLQKREKQLTPMPLHQLSLKQQATLEPIARLQKSYVEYIRLYIGVSNKTSILSKAMSKLPDEIIQSSAS